MTLSNVLLSFALKGVIVLFCGLGPGIWRTFPSSTARVQSAESAVWMWSMVLLQMPLANRLAAV